MQREDRCMNTQHLQTGQTSNALRAFSADFFKMDLPQLASCTLMQDPKPLRRALGNTSLFDELVGTENMCQALWQLMERC
jgi:hypothetical protein